LPNAKILENIPAISDVSQQLVVRVPVIPNINDDVDNMSAIATFSTQLPHLKGVQILPLHETPSYRYERLGKSYHQGSMAYIESETLDHLVDIYRSQCLNVSISPLITAD
jgi:pyruvate formate lyase activating enzyme